MVVAGSGPSLSLLKQQDDIFALGGAHDWLIERGIIPHAWINADPLPLVANYLKNPHPEVVYYLASHTHRFVFNALEGHKIVLWHNGCGVDLSGLAQDGDLIVFGGSTGATRAPNLGHALGYRAFEFYGVDGSGGHLAENQRARPDEEMTVNGRTFTVPRNFINQAHDFVAIRDLLEDCSFKVHGDGLMAWL